MLEFINYSKYSLVLRGKDTKKIKKELKDLGCKYNPNLTIGKGWLFKKEDYSDITDMLDEQEIDYTEDIEDIDPEDVRKNYEEKLKDIEMNIKKLEKKKRHIIVELDIAKEECKKNKALRK